jgi:hypothetical protein
MFARVVAVGYDDGMSRESDENIDKYDMNNRKRERERESRDVSNVIFGEHFMELQIAPSTIFLVDQRQHRLTCQ